RDRPLPAERGGARPQHLRQAGLRGVCARGARRACALARPWLLPDGRGGRPRLVAAAADGAQRGGRRAGDRRGGRGAGGEARLRRGAVVPLLLPEARALAAARRERGAARGAGAGGRRLRAPDGGAARPPRHPGSGAHVMRPVVGITLGDGDRPGYHSMREDYVRSVERSEAVPVVLPALRPGDAAALLDRLDGLVLSGGIDVDPALYGAPPHPKLGRVDRHRDEFELALTREALARDMPLLAICRGQQVLNVATGGSLVQDIPSELKGAV